jgi:hypothetical protein
MLRNRWELDGNSRRTTKSSTPALPKNKKALGPWCMLSHLLGLKNFFFAYLCFLPFLAKANSRGKTMGEYYNKVKNKSFKSIIFFWAHGGSNINSIRSQNIIHKLPLRIPCQFFIYLHFLGPLNFQALCKMNLYHDSPFPSIINSLLHWSWAVKL